MTDLPTTFERELPIIDPHHHLWDVATECPPWLRPDHLIPFRYGDYSAIKQRFMPETYREVSAAHRVIGSVTVEAEWDEARLVEETRWISTIAAAHGLPLGHIARTFLHLPRAAEELATHASHKLVRGIRHKPTAAARPDLVTHATPASMSDPAWRRGFKALAPFGLHFELQAPWWHAGELLDLIAAIPDVPVVINHAFLPADRTPDAIAGWKAALRLAASAPQVSIKISGIGIKGQPWRVENHIAIIHDLIETFGTERAMFASNFPVDGLCGSFDTIFAGFKAATRDLTPADRLKLFHDNAVRIYRLALPSRAVA